jgi:hypothetical protein
LAKLYELYLQAFRRHIASSVWSIAGLARTVESWSRTEGDTGHKGALTETLPSWQDTTIMVVAGSDDAGLHTMQWVRVSNWRVLSRRALDK